MTRFVPPQKNTPHVKPAVVEKVSIMLKKGRREFGSMGANYTEQAYSNEWRKRDNAQPKTADAMVKAEREIGALLLEWVQKHNNSVLISSLYTPYMDGERLNDENFNATSGFVHKCFTGHIIVIGTEIIIVDAYPFNKKKRYEVDKDNNVLQSGKEFEYTGIVDTENNLNKWLDYLPDCGFTAIVCFTGEEATVTRYQSWFDAPFRLIEKEKIVEFLDLKYKQAINDEDKDTIDPNIIAQILVRGVKPYDKYANIINSTALKTFK